MIANTPDTGLDIDTIPCAGLPPDDIDGVYLQAMGRNGGLKAPGAVKPGALQPDDTVRTGVEGVLVMAEELEATERGLPPIGFDDPGEITQHGFDMNGLDRTADGSSFEVDRFDLDHERSDD